MSSRASPTSSCSSSAASRFNKNSTGAARARLVISLRGTKSNHDAIGARVEVDGQVKWVVAGSGYLSQHTKRLHFGLGDRKRTAETLGKAVEIIECDRRVRPSLAEAAA